MVWAGEPCAVYEKPDPEGFTVVYVFLRRWLARNPRVQWGCTFDSSSFEYVICRECFPP